MNFRSLTAGAVAVALLAGSSAQAVGPGDKIAAEAVVNGAVFSQGEDPFPDHHVTYPNGVTGIPDMTYKIVDGYRPMKLDLYLPPAAFAKKGPRPMVVFIHGGGWTGGGPRLSGAFKDWTSVLASIAAQGYVVAAVSYRFSGEAPAPAAIQDVKSSIRWLRVNAAKYNIDKSRVMTWGGSAGGQLAALAATSCGVAALEPAATPSAPGRGNIETQRAASPAVDQESDCVQGAVTWYGIFDFATMPANRQPKPYLGCAGAVCTADELSRQSAVHYLNDKSPPMLMIHGVLDTTVPVGQSEEFYQAMQARHIRSELLTIPGVNHSFIGKTPDETRAASKQALARTVNFIDATIGDRK
jgi:acetyl esterase/lipase